MNNFLLITALLANGQVINAFFIPKCSNEIIKTNRLNSIKLFSSSPVESDEIYRASEITEGNKQNRFEQKFNDHGVLSTKETNQKADASAGPINYDGLIDSDSFDGGDGQVGVVGDGSNAMEQFDERETKIKGATIVTESKARQMNAWGSNTNYAEELAEKGMVAIDEFGEDKLKVKRQQLENWRNQQELQNMQRERIQELGELTEDETSSATSWKKGAGKSYMDNLSRGVKNEETPWNEFKPKTGPVTAKSDGSAWGPIKLTGKEKIKETVSCLSISGRPGNAVIQVKNTVMTFEPFHCEFVGDAEGFNVEPKSGTLNRRSGDPIPINVSFISSGPGDEREATLVVETEEDKFVYKIQGSSQ